MVAGNFLSNNIQQLFHKRALPGDDEKGKEAGKTLVILHDIMQQKKHGEARVTKQGVPGRKIGRK